MSRDNVTVTLEKGVAAGIYGREAGAAAKQSTVWGQPLQQIIWFGMSVVLRLSNLAGNRPLRQRDRQPTADQQTSDLGPSSTCAASTHQAPPRYQVQYERRGWGCGGRSP